MSCEEKEKIQEVSGVVFAILDDNKVLLEERIDPNGKFFGFTIIPGGRVENETISHALEREVIEECGVEVLGSNLLGILTEREGGVNNTRYFFIVTDYRGEITNRESKNIQKWATIEEAYEICKHPLTQRFLNMLSDNLNLSR